jgi:SpoVK/Ycf46/Vps4 family AAA+-type ATPase
VLKRKNDVNSHAQATGPNADENSSSEMADTVKLLAATVHMAAKNNNFSNVQHGGSRSSDAFSDTMSRLSGTNDDPDKLDLSGLLNVLDGVIESPDRMIIISTNIPDKLDDALVRPGRIDHIIEMGHVTPNQANLMLMHFFSAPTTDAQFNRLSTILHEDTWEPLPNISCGETCPKFSPAELEQLCSDSISIDDCLDKLAARAKAFSERQSFRLPCLARQVSYQSRLQAREI